MWQFYSYLTKKNIRCDIKNNRLTYFNMLQYKQSYQNFIQSREIYNKSKQNNKKINKRSHCRLLSNHGFYFKSPKVYTIKNTVIY